MNLDTGGAIICTHCAFDGLALKRAVRSSASPSAPGDTGWQFHCGAHTHDASTALIWTLAEIVEIDASVQAIVDAPIGSVFEKVGQGWRKTDSS